MTTKRYLEQGGKLAKEVGIALTIIGAIGAVIGVGLMLTCTSSFFGTCLSHNYSGVGILIGLGSGVMLVLGIVLLATTTKPVNPVQSPFAPTFAQFPAPPVGAATPQGAAPQPNCNVCGQPLAWIAAQNRWYCSRCGQYR
jgi:hypothetical protein